MRRLTHWSSIRRYALQAGAVGFIPTFRPDAVVNIDADGWRDNIDKLSDVASETVSDYGS